MSEKTSVPRRRFLKASATVAIGGGLASQVNIARSAHVAGDETIKIGEFVEECEHGIRSTVVCPGAVATPIMEQRDPPEPPEELARMVQPEDLAAMRDFFTTQISGSAVRAGRAW